MKKKVTLLNMSYRGTFVKQKKKNYTKNYLFHKGIIFRGHVHMYRKHSYFIIKETNNILLLK